ncbi:MAG: InlB B-repeat-containing protein [Bacilli bacterium]|nr:InlB B-repeat-containing protein [Bacilli bacterium]
MNSTTVDYNHGTSISYTSSGTRPVDNYSVGELAEDFDTPAGGVGYYITGDATWVGSLQEHSGKTSAQKEELAGKYNASRKLTAKGKLTDKTFYLEGVSIKAVNEKIQIRRHYFVESGGKTSTKDGFVTLSLDSSASSYASIESNALKFSSTGTYTIWFNETYEDTTGSKRNEGTIGLIKTSSSTPDNPTPANLMEEIDQKQQPSKGQAKPSLGSGPSEAKKPDSGPKRAEHDNSNYYLVGSGSFESGTDWSTETGLRMRNGGGNNAGALFGVYLTAGDVFQIKYVNGNAETWYGWSSLKNSGAYSSFRPAYYDYYNNWTWENWGGGNGDITADGAHDYYVNNNDNYWGMGRWSGTVGWTTFNGLWQGGNLYKYTNGRQVGDTVATGFKIYGTDISSGDLTYQTNGNIVVSTTGYYNIYYNSSENKVVIDGMTMPVLIGSINNTRNGSRSSYTESTSTFAFSRNASTGYLELSSFLLHKDDTVKIYGTKNGSGKYASYNSNLSSNYFALSDSEKYIKIKKTGLYTFSLWKDIWEETNPHDDSFKSGNLSSISFGYLTTAVTLNQQSGSGGSDSVTASYDAAMPSATMPTRSGYTFSGYYTGTGGSGTKYYNADGSSAKAWDFEDATKTLYAYWRAVYVVHYDGNGNTGGTAPSDSEETASGDNVTVADIGTLVKIGYIFDHWDTKDDGSGTDYLPGDEHNFDNNTTLYAIWTPITYSVRFNKNDGSGTTSTQDGTFTYGTGKTLSTIASLSWSKTGYSFLGWAYTSDGAKAINNGASLSTPSDDYVPANNGTLDLYAKWQAISTDVTLDNDGGSTNKTIVATYDSAMPLTVKGGGALSAPTKTGYLFGGYFTAKNGGGTQYYTYSNSTLSSTRNWAETSVTTLYAKWTAITYEVKYNANGGSDSMSNSTHTYGTAKTLTANAFTRTGYSFAGWATTSDGAEVYNDEQSVTNLANTQGAIFNLYAVWSPDGHTITLNGNGGTPSSSSFTHYYDTPESLSGYTATRDGYTFVGWFEATTGTDHVTAVPSSLNEADTYYAHWVQNTSVVLDVSNVGWGTVYLKSWITVDGVYLENETTATQIIGSKLFIKSFPSGASFLVENAANATGSDRTANITDISTNGTGYLVVHSSTVDYSNRKWNWQSDLDEGSAAITVDSDIAASDGDHRMGYAIWWGLDSNPNDYVLETGLVLNAGDTFYLTVNGVKKTTLDSDYHATSDGTKCTIKRDGRYIFFYTTGGNIALVEVPLLGNGYHIMKTSGSSSDSFEGGVKMHEIYEADAVNIATYKFFKVTAEDVTNGTNKIYIRSYVDNEQETFAPQGTPTVGTKSGNFVQGLAAGYYNIYLYESGGNTIFDVTTSGVGDFFTFNYLDSSKSGSSATIQAQNTTFVLEVCFSTVSQQALAVSIIPTNPFSTFIDVKYYITDEKQEDPYVYGRERYYADSNSSEGITTTANQPAKLYFAYIVMEYSTWYVMRECPQGSLSFVIQGVQA